VDFQGSWLRLEPGETKNGEGRNFPLTRELRNVLEKRHIARPKLRGLPDVTFHGCSFTRTALQSVISATPGFQPAMARGCMDVFRMTFDEPR
jgi:hypothetical protein